MMHKNPLMQYKFFPLNLKYFINNQAATKKVYRTKINTIESFAFYYV